MAEKQMKNSYIISVLNTMNDETGKALYKKKLPVKLLYNLRRSLPEVESAYSAYIGSLKDICARYGTTPDKLECEDEEKHKQLLQELTKLLNAETPVRVYTVPAETIEECGGGAYDPLTFEEIDRLWWLVEEDEKA